MKNYTIVIGSPIDYEELTADVIIGGEYIVRVQKEEGIDKMKIEFFEKPLNAKIYLNDFIAALNEAKELLLE